ncbi:MAG: rhomboid family intramembrane serine protease [Pseudomonadota bacterium]
MSQPAQGKPYTLRRPNRGTDPSRVFNVPGVVFAIAALCVAFFAFMWLAPSVAARVIEGGAAISPRRFLSGPEGNGGVLAMLSPLIAHMFVHASLMHLLFNVLWLFAFGAPIARRMGAVDALQSSSAMAAAGMFLTFYFLCGAAAALTYIYMHANDNVLMVGASGGVSGLMGGVVRFAFNRSSLFGPEYARVSGLLSPSVIAWSAVIIVTNVVFGVFGGAFMGGAEIAWEAHIGGYIFGLLTYPFFERAAAGLR